MKEKIFKDPIHGYISLPSLFCDVLLDSPLMQRLRNITQTSMRVLYPSAHHDRFTHSLGTYHLGSIAFHHLIRNIQEKYANEFAIIKTNEEKYKNTFLIACLLHDCAHAPFSHTFEHFYKVNALQEDIREKMAEIDSDFEKDYKYCSPKDHELMSALMILENYKEFIEVHGYLSLIIRSIIGCQHTVSDSFKLHFENALIALLNGNAIDVDKLDYIMRDSWTSGFNNMSIDIHRLLSSVTLTRNQENNFVLAFKKNALSVIQNVITARNYLYEWIYCHHKVVYETELLKISLKKIVAIEGQDLLTTLFSKDVFLSNKEYKDYSFYLPTDGDILYIFKKYYHQIKEVEELFSRKHKRAIWKSYAEFDTHFKSKSDKTRINMYQEASDLLKEKLSFNEDDFLILKAKADVKEIRKNDIFIEIDDQCISFDIFIEKNMMKPFDFFYLYLDKEKEGMKKEIISQLNRIC